MSPQPELLALYMKDKMKGEGTTDGQLFHLGKNS